MLGPMPTKPERITNRAYASRMGNRNEKSGDGWHYRGFGLVQITGEANYTKFGCVQNPDMALAPAIRILFDGMINGAFTGKSLPIASAGPPLIGSAPGRLSIRAVSAT
jgi:putative chitinase